MKDEFSLKHLWVAGLLLLLAAFYYTWRDEFRHSNQLIADTRAIAKERDRFEKMSDDEAQSLRKRDELLYQSNTEFMNLSNRILDVTKPEALKITVAGERLPYYGGSQPHEMMMLAFPNKVVGAVDAAVDCDKDIQSARAAMLGHDLWMGKGVQLDKPRSFYVNITNPIWTPTQPLVVYIAFKNELATECRVTQQ